MRVAVVMNSREQQALAGARIRYQRITPHLARSGHALEFVTIADFDAKNPPLHDTYLFSKCQDARIMIARLLRAHGHLVGIDGFDDYFSHSDDSRLVRQRSWLKEMSACCDFFICSTERMYAIFAEYIPGRPGHILNDPYEVFSPKDIAPSMERRLETALADRHVEVAWFGVGDNRNFSVGIADLAAQASKLTALRRRGFSITLSVLTNKRALTADGLAALRRIDVDTRVDEWSLEAEAQLLSRSLVGFLPVNAQPFSIAKSLNRAVTALTAGVQVLSSNYRLYRPLGRFIYDSSEELAQDLEAGAPKLSSASLPELTEVLTAWSDPVAEARSLATFLDKLPRRADVVGAWPERKMAMLAGVRSPAVVPQLVHRMEQLTVGGLFTPGKVDDDVLFLREEKQIRIRLSPGALACLGAEAALQVSEAATPLIGGGREMRLSDFIPGRRLASFLTNPATILAHVADYPVVIAEARRMLGALLPDVDILLSEAEAPFAEEIR